MEENLENQVKEMLSDVDRLTLELSKSNVKLALAEAKTALAMNEKAELSYKYIVLQLFRKYGLADNDSINENGEIVRAELK